MADADYRRGLRHASDAELIGMIEERTGKKVFMHDPEIIVNAGKHITESGFWCSYEPESCAYAFTLRLTDSDGRVYTCRDYLTASSIYPVTIDEKTAAAKDIISRLGAIMASALTEQPLEDLLGRGY